MKRVRLDGYKPYKRPKNVVDLPNGRRPFQPTEEQRRLVREVRAHNLSLDDIALLITNPSTGKSIDTDTLNKHFSQELALGMVHAKLRVGKAVFDMAIGRPATIIEEKQLAPKGKVQRKQLIIEPGVKPDINAAKWWEQSRAGYTDKPKGSEDTIPNQVVVILPSNGRDRFDPKMIEAVAVNPGPKVVLPSNGRDRSA